MTYGLQKYIETGKLEQLRQELIKAEQSGQGTPHDWAAAKSSMGAAVGARKYIGEKAGEGYRKKREGTPKWEVEQKIIERMLDDLPEGDWVLDAPVGEGRFIPFYESKKFIIRGLDISKDQLEATASKVTNPDKVRLGLGDIRSIPLESKSVDAFVMCRITRWLSPEDCQAAFREAMRVARKRIIVTARQSGTFARPLSLFETLLEDGWELAENAPGYEDDYRILRFERESNGRLSE